MNNDAAFVTGEDHWVCQDHARCNGDAIPRAGVEAADPFIVISDGCSDPRAVDVHLGSAMLCLAAAKKIREGASHISAILSFADSLRKQTGLDRTALDATLLYARLDRANGNVVAHVHGDGVVSAIRRDGTRTVTLLEFESGYPAYPAYSLDPERAKALSESFNGNLMSVRHVTTSEAGEVLTDRTFHMEGPFVTAFPVEDYSDLFLMSDGVQRVKRIELDGSEQRMDPLEVCLKLMRPSPNRLGPYCLRSLRRFVRECKRDNWEPYDDLSLAGIHLG